MLYYTVHFTPGDPEPGVHTITYNLPWCVYKALVAVLPDAPVLADIPAGPLELWIRDQGRMLYFGTSEITEAEPLPPGLTELPPDEGLTSRIYSLPFFYSGWMESVPQRHGLLLAPSKGPKQFDPARIVGQLIFGLYITGLGFGTDGYAMHLRFRRHYLREAQ